MGKPEVMIEVDEATGRWSVDALPMILIPQHFFLNHHLALEAELGRERLEAVLHPAGYASAHQWCEREAAHHGLAGINVFHHYLKRLSQRGWGRLAVRDLDQAAGIAHVELHHSVFVGRPRRSDGEGSCYRFASWLEGSLDYVAGAAGNGRRHRAREVHCASDGTHDHCLFAIEASD